MAKRQLSIQDSVDTEEEYLAYLDANADKIICMEVYAEFCGPSFAMGNAVRKGKLEIGGDDVAMVKACTDNIPQLDRFKYKSEPTFLFILNHQLSTVLFGANGIELCNILEQLLAQMKKEVDTGQVIVPRHPLEELLPEEIEKMEADIQLDKEFLEATERLRVLTIAARKQRICERLSRAVKRLNFILFWPLHHQAHYDLYEKWDYLNIQVAAKDEVQLTEDDLKEVFYMSDVDLNEACVHHVTEGPALVVLFKMFDTDDRDFVKLMRHALYEEIPEPKEDVPPEKQLPPIPAFERYASISKTIRQVRRERYDKQMQKIKQEKEEAERLQRETERLERQAQEEREKEEKQRKDDERMARLAAGLPPSPEPEEVAPEELAVEGEEAEAAAEVEGEEGATEPVEEPEEGEAEAVAPEEAPEPQVFRSDVTIEGEDYIPPGGLFVPGLYSPPNELAKANGLKFFYPKIIKTYAELESEILPPHVLVMFPVDKRNEVGEVINLYKDEILNMGFFVGEDPYHAEHVAYSIKQYNKMTRYRKHLDRLAVAVSRKRSLPLLQLAGLNPMYISSDRDAGERDCLALFPVGYGDEFEEEESVEEEAVKEVVVVKEEVKEEAKVEEVVEEEEEDMDI